MSATCRRKPSPKILSRSRSRYRERKCLPQLLRTPLRGWMGRDVEVDHATPFVSQHQKHIEDLKADGGHGEEVHRDQSLDVIIQESAPGLRRRFPAPDHVFGHAGLADVDTQFEQLTMDVGRAPERIFSAHRTDQITDLAADGRSARLTASNFPCPEQAKAFAMPADDGFGLDDGKSRAPVTPNSR